VIYGIKQLALAGEAWLPTLSVLAGLALGAAFVRRQRRLPDPLLDLRLFRVPAFSAALGTYAAGIFVVSGRDRHPGRSLALGDRIGLWPRQASIDNGTPRSR
jgi:MFS transporter, DHA2 family, multidrug resistance protein